jgi:hypothetical protein
MTRPAGDRWIIAVDGEGEARQGERAAWHSYVLLAAADDEGFRRHVASPPTAPRREANLEKQTAANYGLPTKACLDFLLDLPPEAIKVAFAFGYDVTKILADLPLTTLKTLAAADSDVYVKWQGYTIYYTPRKKFTVRKVTRWSAPQANGKRKPLAFKECIVWDVWGFYQASFVKALKDWKVAPADRVEHIAYMKDHRDEFENLPDAQVLAYCYEECEYLTKLVREVVTHAEALGLDLRGRYDGAGALASAWFQKEGIKAYLDPTNLPDDTIDTPDGPRTAPIALHAYFGGRFEISVMGRAGDLYSNDINSAYPSVAVGLPCLKHGNFRRTDRLEAGRLAVYKVRSQTSGPYAPFPFRDQDRMVYYAHGGIRWAWHLEVEAAARHFPGQVDVLDGWVWEPACEHHPFASVADLYDYRRKLKAEGNGAEKVLKLIINSIYGKTAQTLGGSVDRKTGERRPPPFQSFIWAGLITSGCRAQILDALMVSGSVVSIATDGILSREPIPGLAVSKQLGDWEAGRLFDTYLFQSGIYAGSEAEAVPTGAASREAGDLVYKTRGFSAREMAHTDLIEGWEQGQGKVTTTTRRFLGIKLGVTRLDALDVIGQWPEGPREVQFAFTRRLPLVEYGPTGMPRELRGQSEPYVMPLEGPGSESLFYVPKQGWDEGLTEQETEAILEALEQPD